MSADAPLSEDQGLSVEDILCPHGWRRPEHGGLPCALCLDGVCCERSLETGGMAHNHYCGRSPT